MVNREGNIHGEWKQKGGRPFQGPLI